ncbi:MAG: retroviral-like aspartic protease family protein [Candidatus Anammoxibacter sp.]
MGEIKIRALLKNYGSVWAAQKGYIMEAEIQSSEIEMVVDTGAVMIFLPQDEVEKLGLEPVRLEPAKKVVVTYADERKEERWIAKGLEITIGNRSMVTDCIIGPPLCEPLLGRLVLEELDLIVDSARKTICSRPESPNLPLLKIK